MEEAEKVEVEVEQDDGAEEQDEDREARMVSKILNEMCWGTRRAG